MEDLERLKNWIKEGREFDIIDFFSTLHAADIADLIEALDEDEKKRLFALLAVEQASDVLLELNRDSMEEVLEDIPRDRLAHIVKDMESDDAADIIGTLPDAAAQDILESIGKKDAEEVRSLLAYPEESAGGLMQTELVQVLDSDTVADAIQRIREIGKETEDIHFIYVTDKDNVLVGVLPLSKLILAKPDEKISNIMERNPISVRVDTDQEEVAKIFMKYDIVALPVVDEKGVLLGRITMDDIIDVVEEEASEDFLRMAGTSEDELLMPTKVLRVARLRLPFLLTNLFGGLLTGYLMWLFKLTLRDALALVTFIPVITGMGGNAGLQSSTIVVRGIATNSLGLMPVGKLVVKQFLVGLAMGAVCGATVGTIGWLWHGSFYIGVVVCMAMIVAITVACSMGALVPMVFNKLHIDPAISSGPFVTTANDITGIIIYLSIATALLHYAR